MVRGARDERDVDVGLAQALGGEQPAEAGPDHHDVRAVEAWCGAGAGVSCVCTVLMRTSGGLVEVPRVAAAGPQGETSWPPGAATPVVAATLVR